MNHAIKINLEKGLYLLAFSLALAVRLWGLGNLPLSDPEANLAMQSWNLAGGQGGAIPSEPAYVLLTGGLFSLTQANEFAARFWPAILGAMLPITAFLMRKQIGLRPAVVLAFGLALDPGLVALSRQANGVAMALPLVLMAAALLIHTRAENANFSLVAGIFGGLAFLGGASLWPGIVGIGLAIRIFKLFGGVFEGGLGRIDWKLAGWGALGAIIVVGTLLMTTPAGLGGIGSSLGQYFGGWAGNPVAGISLVQMLVMLPVYHILALVFGLVGLVRALFNGQDQVGRSLGVWLGVALLLALIYPARQVTDLAWVLIPLWALAAREIGRTRLSWNEHSRAEILHALLVVLLIIFLTWSYERIPNPAFDTGQMFQQAVVRVLAGFFLFLLTFGLVVWGWGYSVASRGLRLGFLLVFFFFTVSTTLNSAGLRGAPETEMWRTGSLPKDAVLMQTTLDDLSSWKHHSPAQLDVAVVGIQSDSLRWMLRKYDNVRYMEVIATEDSPSVIIARLQSSLAQSSGYRGQDFVWWSAPAWSQISPYEFVRWVFLRQVQMDNQSVILWVRSDIFPGADSNSNLP
jgi:hypothetical protein